MRNLRKSKLLVFIAVIAVLSLMTCIFVACNEDETQQTTTFDVVFDLNDGSGETVTQNVNPHEITYTPPTREGYDFLHWTMDREGQTPLSVDDIKNGVVLYAQWQIKTYTVKFYDEDLNLISSVTVNHGASATPPTQDQINAHLKDGRAFVGWNQSLDNVTRNFSVEMVTVANTEKFTVVFMDGDKEVATFENGTAGTIIPKPDNPQRRDGFHFDGWKTKDGKAYSEENMFATDETYYSVWTLQDPTAPQITGDDSVVYGNIANMSIQQNSVQEFDGINYVYEWLDSNDNVVASGNSYQTSILATGEYSYKIRVTASCEGYESKSAVSSAKSLTVEKATLTATLTGATLVYGDDVPASLPVSFTGFVNGDDASVVNSDNLRYVTTYTAGKNVGKYSVTATGFQAQNYNFTVQSATLTVEQKQISVAKSFEKVYDGTNATAQATEAQGLLDGHAITVTLTTAGANVGDYALDDEHEQITFEKEVLDANQVDVTDNYVILVTASASILPADIDYELPEATTFDFDGNRHGAQLLVTTPNCRVEYSADNVNFNQNAPQFVNAGSYTIYAKISCANYNPVENSFDITINKAHIAFKATNQNATYGQDFVLDQTAYVVEDGETFGATFDVKLATEYVVGNPVRNYTIRVTATEMGTNNFDITTKAGYVAVGRATINVALQDKEVTYGEDFAPTTDLATVDGVYDNDDIKLALSTTYDKATARVNKAEKITATIDNANYTLGEVTGGNVTVIKRNVALTVNNASVVYGENFDFATLTTDKDSIMLANGDVFGNIAFSYAGDEYAQGANAGSTFAVTATAPILNGDDDRTANYNITVTNGTLSVAQREVSVKVNDVSVIYGDEIANSQYGYTVTSGSFFNEENIKANYSTEYAAGNFGDGYVVNASINDANHKINITAGVVNITKRNVTATYSANFVQTKLGVKPTVDLSAFAFVNKYTGDAFSGVLQTVSAENGTYTYSENGLEWTTALKVQNVKGDDVTAMYNVSLDVTMIIAESTIEHTSTPQNATYNGKEQTLNGLKVTETGLKNRTVKYSTNLEDGYTLDVAPTFKNAGDYTVYFLITADDKTPTEGNYTVAIAKKAVTISADDKTTTYGDVAPEYTHTVDGIIAGDTINVTPACAYAQGNAVGTYDITVEYQENANYNVTTVDGTLTVKQRVVNVALQDKEVTYGEDFAPTTDLATVDGVYDKDDIKLALSTTYDKATARVNKAEKITATIDNANYTLGEVTGGNVTVIKRNIALIVNDASVVYGENFDFATLTTDKDSITLANGDVFGNIAFSYAGDEYAQGANAGSTFAVTATAPILNGEDDRTANYNITVTNGTLTVEKRKVNVTTNSFSVVYGSDVDTSKIGYTVIDGSFYGTPTITNYAFEDYAPGMFGEFCIDIELDKTTCANHEITLASGKLTVTPCEITVHHKANVAKTDKPYMFTIAKERIDNTFDGDIITITLTTASADVGIYTANGELGTQFNLDSATFKKADGTDVSAAYTVKYDLSIEITEKKILYTANGENATYNNTEHHGTVNVTDASITDYAIKYAQDEKPSTHEGYTLDSAPSFKDAGTHIVYFLITADGKTPTEGSYTVNIAKAKITFTANAQTAIFSDEFTLNKDAYTVTGEMYGTEFDVALATPYVVGNDVGTYAITLTATEKSTSNFEISTADSTLTVSAKEVIVTANDVTATYGTEERMPEFTVDVEQAKDFISLSAPDYTAKSNVGEYAITATSSSTNYTVNLASAYKVIVGKKAITVTADNQSMTYGDAIPTLTYKQDGVVEGDTLSGVSLAITKDGNVMSGTLNAGEYVITLTVDENANTNYAITTNNGTLTVDKRNVTITTNNVEVTYGDALDSTKFGYTLAEGNAFVGDVTANYSTEYAPGNFGSFTITAVFDEATRANHNILQTSGNVTINAREVTVSYTETVAMTGEAHEFILSNENVHNIYAGDSINGTLRTASANIGKYIANGELSNQFVVVNEVYFNNADGVRLGAGAYVIKYALNIEITEEKIPFSANGITATYNNTEYQGSVTVNDASITDYAIKYAQDEKPSTHEGYTLDTAPSFKDAGTHIVYFLITADGKTPTEGSYTVNIAKAKITFTANAQTAIFSDEFTLSQDAYTVTGDKYGTEFDVALATPYVVGNDVGTYAITLKATEKATSNFEISTVDSTLTVSAKEVIVTASDVNAAYGTEERMPEFAVDVEQAKDFIALSAPDYTAKSPVGEYAITATSSSTNYTVNLASAYKVIVGKKAITVTADNQSMTYGDAIPALTYKQDGIVEGDTLSGITLAITKDGNVMSGTLNAGEYVITLTADENANTNYAITTNNGTLTVDRRNVSIKTNDKAVTYGDALDLSKHSYTVTDGSFLDADTIIPTYSTEYAPGKFGSFTITAVFDEATKANYNITQADGAVTINAREVTVSYTETVAMTGKAYTFDLSKANVHNEYAGDAINGTLRTASANIGKYIANGELSDQFVVVNEVYFNNSEGVRLDAGAYTIKYDLSIELIEDKILYTANGITATYNNTEYQGSVTVNDASITDYAIKYAQDEKPSTHEGYTLDSAPSFTNAGAYTVYFLITADGKTPTEGSYTVNIAKAKITFTANAQTAIFSDEFTLSQDAYTVTGDKYGTEFDVALATPYVVGNDVGTYAITLTATEKATSNFEISTVDSTLTVSAKEVIVTASDVTATYGTEERMPEFTVDVEQAKDFISLSAPDYTAKSPVGEYAITATSSSTNYTVNLASAYKVIVGKKAITVTADNQSMTYGDAIPTLTYKQDGIVEGDTLSGITLAITKDGNVMSGTLNAGEYVITLTADASANANYSIMANNGTLTVEKRNVTVKVNDVSVVYGNAIADSKFGYTVTNGSFVGAVTPTYGTTYSEGAFGTHHVAVEFDSATVANHNITCESGNVTILKRDVTVEGAKEFVQNEGAFHAIDLSTLTLMGAYSRDTLAGVITLKSDQADEFSATTLDKFNVTQPIALTNANGNDVTAMYNLAYDISVKVVVKYVNVDTTEKKATYNGANQNQNLTLPEDIKDKAVVKYAVEEVLTEAKAAAEIEYTLDTVLLTKAGTYKVFFRIVVDGYTTTFGFYIVKIDKLTATITASNQTTAYGEQIDSTAFTTDGILDSDLAGFNIHVTTTTTNPSVGNYANVLTIAYTENANYEIVTTKGTWNVTQKQLTVTAENVNVTYGESAPALTPASVTGLVDGDTTTNVTLTSTYAKGSPVGSYKISATCSSDNYSVTFGEYFVNVSKRHIDFNVSVGSVTYGDNFTLNDCMSNKDSITLPNGDTFGEVTFSYVGDAYTQGTRAGKTIEVTASVQIFNGTEDRTANYDLNIASHTFGVYRAILTATITLDKNSIVYGDPLPTPSVAYTGFVLGETNSVITGTPKPVFDSQEPNVGSHSVTIENLSVTADNYDIRVTPATFEVTKATLTVNADDAEVTFGEEPKPDCTLGGLLDRDKDKESAIKNSIKYTYTDSANAEYVAWSSGINQTYTITANPNTVLDNYTVVAGTTGTLKINARHVDVTITGTATVVYGTNNANFDNVKCVGNDSTHDLGDIEYELVGYTTTTNAGKYQNAVKIKSYSNQNFVIDNIDTALGELEVLQADITGISGNTIQEFEYDGSAKTFDTSVLSAYVGNETNKIDGTFTTFSVTDAGTFAKVLTFTSSSGNYKPADIKVYIKNKSVVDDSGKKYTIEDAFKNVSSGKIKLTTSTSFADEFNGECYYNKNDKGVLTPIADYYTLKSNVTLLLPFSNTDTQGWIAGGEDGASDGNFAAHPASNGKETLYIKLTVPTSANLTINGNITVGAMTGSKAAGTNQNAISGNYSQIVLDGKMTIDTSTLRVMGYITGNGEIISNGASIVENLVLTGWPGGSAGVARFVGSKSPLTLLGTSKIDNPKVFPFSDYKLRSIQVKTTLNYGSSLKGYVKIATSAQDLKLTKIAAQINEAMLTFITSSTTAGDGLLHLANNTAKIIKSFSNSRTQYDLYGSVTDGYSSLDLNVLGKSISLSTDKIVFPINGIGGLTLKSGCTFSQSYSYKLMPGATFNVESGATYNLNSGAKLVIYSGTWKDPQTVGYSYPTGRGDAVLSVNGTMNVYGSLGGVITGTGSVKFDTNCTITSVQSMEGNGTTEGSGLSKKFVFTESPWTGNATLSGYSGTITNGKTYTYNGSTWA